ncbi:hypothetical protein [Fusobacterium ulcerans]|uniref:hypothetical protein n=1 Tax=Fusobacterium ulcerans TaxID=861 RepID=UPI001D0BA611|nr:hypothetical protein [Fusobacterium ulcerans]MCB8563726.1 hypothetical protein [Fusobacterium ulcerans]MCB8649679.1 hypothetical protein [Fusobacterium ulcerans]
MEKRISIAEIAKFLNKLSGIVANSNNESFLMFLTSSYKVKVINNNGNMEFYIYHPKADLNKKFNKIAAGKEIYKLTKGKVMI